MCVCVGMAQREIAPKLSNPFCSELVSARYGQAPLSSHPGPVRVRVRWRPLAPRGTDGLAGFLMRLSEMKSELGQLPGVCPRIQISNRIGDTHKESGEIRPMFRVLLLRLVAFSCPYAHHTWADRACRSHIAHVPPACTPMSTRALGVAQKRCRPKDPRGRCRRRRRSSRFVV